MPPRKRETTEAAQAVAPEPDDGDTPVDPVAPEPDAPAPAAPTEKGKYGLLNPGTSPITYTDDGRSIGAGERIRVDSLDQAAQSAIERGYLVQTD